MSLKKRHYAILVSVLLMIMPFAYAGLFENILEITGWGTSGTTAPTVAITNGTPVILAIYVPTVTLTEAGSTNVEMSYIVNDKTGIHDFINESTNVSFYKAGETQRVNDTSTAVPACVAVIEGSNATTQNYTCTLQMWYWDADGSDWIAEAQAGDNITNVTSTTTFTVNTLSAMNMTPNTLTWGSIFIGDTNQLSNNDPVIATNTGNQDVTATNVEAISLIGGTTNTIWIPAANFTVNTADACEGTAMVNDTATPVASSTITHAPASAKNFYACLEEAGQDLTEQTYSTTGDVEDWTVSVST